MQDLNYEETIQAIKCEMFYLSEMESKKRNEILKNHEWRKTQTINSQFTHKNYAVSCFNYANNKGELLDKHSVY